MRKSKTNYMDVNIKDAYIQDYATYSVLVNHIRMIPDIRDGLKTVHRRILDAMFNHLPCKTSMIKTASIAGKVMQVSHPHGDTSIGDTIALMATWFNYKEPLVTGQGNFGTITGEGAAAMRYTEAKLSPYALECILGDLSYNKDIVDWRQTFTGKDYEPEFLPVKVPNLLINGSYGIGIGILSGIPKHNLGEVIDAVVQYIDNPQKPIILYPDHCLPVDIIDTDFKSICKKGHGKYRARGRIEVIDDKDRPVLIITSVPDGVDLTKVEEKIEKLVESKQIQVYKINDKSVIDFKKDVQIMRMEILLKKGADPYYTRDVIYNATNMESTYSIDFMVLLDREPVRIGYKAYIEYFINFRKMCMLRLYHNIVQYHNTKKHELEAFIKLLQSNKVDKIINIIRKKNSDSDEELINYIVKSLNITDLQAKFIINAPLKRLSKKNLDRYVAESEEHKKQIQYYANKLLDENNLLQDIKDELLAIKKKYNKPRTSKIIKDTSNDIPEGEFIITVTHNNFIKKFPLNQDIKNLKNETKFVYKLSNTDEMIILDSMGKCYTLPVHKITPCDKNGTGYSIMNFIKTLTSDIVGVLSSDYLKQIEKKNKSKMQVIIVTSSGLAKRLQLNDFFNIPKSGTIYIRLSDDDAVKHTGFVSNNGELFGIKNNKVLRFNVSDIPTQRRSTKGLNILKLNDPDKMLYMNNHNCNNKYIIITEKGNVNVVPIAKLTRAHSPKNVINLAKSDNILTILPFSKNTTYTLHGYSGASYIIDCNTLELGSTVSKGKKLLSIQSDRIKDISNNANL